jgi:hypothetical protein
MKKPINEQAAQELTDRIISHINSHQEKLRQMLLMAKRRKVYKALGKPNFETYVKECICDKCGHLSYTHALRLVNAAELAMKLYGKQHIGTIPERVMRPFSENIAPEHHANVLDLAKEKMAQGREYPSCNNVIDAAKELGVYHEMSRSAATKSPKTSTSTQGSKAAKAGSDNVIYITDKQQVEAEFNTLTKNYSVKEIRMMIGTLKAMQTPEFFERCTSIPRRFSPNRVAQLIGALNKYLAQQRQMKQKRG